MFDLIGGVVYTLELTRIFCFQYSLFYFHFNLITMCIAIVEGFAVSKKKVGSLFTKQDGYRMLMLTCIYLVMFGGSNWHHGNPKYLFLKCRYAVSVLVPLPLFLLAMRNFKRN